MKMSIVIKPKKGVDSTDFSVKGYGGRTCFLFSSRYSILSSFLLFLSFLFFPLSINMTIMRYMVTA